MIPVPSISPEIFRSFGIRLAYLFGSRAAGRPAEQSDADVAILLCEPHSLDDLCRAVADLESVVGRTLGCAAHVIPLNGASALLRFEAIRHGRVLFAADGAERIQFEVRTLREYEEFRRRQDLYYRAMLTRLVGVAP
ncbi:MAG: nucleotidyltransferase domain-containing protein [candidate division NC10 bacterium]|nr:nucleotidyltransferase domain-containing protein [candidate division NC10 bacterium]